MSLASNRPMVMRNWSETACSFMMIVTIALQKFEIDLSHTCGGEEQALFSTQVMYS